MSDNSSSWVSAFVVGGLVAAFIVFAAVRFSIPAHKPMKHKSEVISQNEKRYFIIYDEDFDGSAVFNSDQRRIDFEISNLSRDPLSFDEAEYFLWTTDHVGYGLEIASLENSSWGNRSLIFNPGDTVQITAIAPMRLPAIVKIQGFSVSLKDGIVPRKIRFGYEKLGWWDRLRWWLAEQIRKN